MSNKAYVLEYLVANSELAKSLDQPVTLDELLAHQPDPEYCIRLLAVTPQLEKDSLKLSNCWIDGVAPYDSLIGLLNEDLTRLKELFEYYMLSNDLCEKINIVIGGGVDIKNYHFDVKNTCEWAKIGDIKGLQWAHIHGYDFHAHTCIYAAENGHLKCLKYLHGFIKNMHPDKIGQYWIKYESLMGAAKYGHLDCLKYLQENECEWSWFAPRYAGLICSAAASNGHLNCLKYLRTADSAGNVCPWPTPWESACTAAAQNGHLDCLRYLHEHGCPWDEETCMNAAFAGQLECLKYAHAPPSGKSCPWNKLTCMLAAEGGHLDCLQYAHTHGCPWDSDTCSAAAENGHLDCLEYARAHGCPEN